MARLSREVLARFGTEARAMHDVWMGDRSYREAIGSGDLVVQGEPGLLKNIGNCQWVSAMNPSAGSSLVNPRLMRWYMVFAVEIPGGESLYAIYNTFLEGHLKPFPDECQKLVSNLIRGALTVQTQVMQTFRKTAVNFHYEFNIRHLSRVFTGLLGSRPEQFKDPDKFVRMWMHESERVYGDILVSYEHLGQYQKLSQGVVKKLFPNVSIDRFYAKSNADPLVYSHFAGGDLTDKLYDEIETYDQLCRFCFSVGTRAFL